MTPETEHERVQRLALAPYLRQALAELQEALDAQTEARRVYDNLNRTFDDLDEYQAEDLRDQVVTAFWTWERAKARTNEAERAVKLIERRPTENIIRLSKETQRHDYY